MKKLMLPLLVLVLWSLNSCQKSEEIPIATDAPQKIAAPFTHCSCASPSTDIIADENAADEEYTSIMEELNREPDIVIQDRANCQPSITIPAGSVDALAGAIDNVCTGGTIWLASGVHTENAGLVINKRVNIRGKNGAVLKIQADPDPIFDVPIDVGLHFNFAAKAKVDNIRFETLNGETGGTAILFQKSHGGVVSNCEFNNFQFSIVVWESVGTKILNNDIVASAEWLTGAISESEGIIVITGEGAQIKGNEVSQATLGIFLSDRNGTYEKNYTHDNFIGMILCNVPKGWITLPGGEQAYAKFPSTNWTAQKNVSQYNYDAGYMVIDGAHKNKLINNKGGNNGTYDIELVGDTERFGFFTPTCYKNSVWAGQYQNITIKDCGLANLVYGGVQINTEEDPCY